jgi:hypothetical protein
VDVHAGNSNADYPTGAEHERGQYATLLSRVFRNGTDVALARRELLLANSTHAMLQTNPKGAAERLASFMSGHRLLKS